MTEKEKRYYYMVGRYFGYPDCCITSFIFNIETSLLYRKPEQLEAASHGFVPCPSCAASILSGKKMVDDLISDRVCPLPFPHEMSEVVDEDILTFKILANEPA